MVMSVSVDSILCTIDIQIPSNGMLLYINTFLKMISLTAAAQQKEYAGKCVWIMLMCKQP